MDKELQDFSNSLATFEEKLVSFVKISLPYLVLLLSILMTVMRSMFSLGFSALTSDFWVNLATNIATTMLTYGVFCSHGAEAFKKMSESYKNNLAQWAQYSNFIRTRFPSLFSTYCQKYAKKCYMERRRARIERYSLISYEEYLEKYAKLTTKQLLEYRDKGEITNDEFRAFLKARRPLRVPHINATSILCGNGSVSVENIPIAKASYVARTIGARPFVILVLSVGWAIVVPTFMGLPVVAVVFSVITSCFMLVFSAIMGNISGNYGARRDASDVKTRIFFCETFLVDEGKMDEYKEKATP